MTAEQRNIPGHIKQAYAEGFSNKMKFLKEALTVLDREPMYKRPVSSTLGRLSSPSTAAVLGSAAPFKPGASLESEKIKAILEAAKDDPALPEDLMVSLGGGRPGTALRRIWANKRIGIPSKLLGTLKWPITQGVTAVNRGDSYDPFANMITLFNDDPALLEHELGHARDYASRDWPGGYATARVLPPVAIYQEHKASKLALKNMIAKALKDGKIDKDERGQILRATRILGGGMGSYIGNAIGGMVPSPVAAPVGALSGGLLGQIIGRSGKAWVPEDQEELLRSTDEDEKSKAVDDVVNKAAEQRNIPGHIKQAYEQGFAAALEKKAGRGAI